MHLITAMAASMHVEVLPFIHHDLQSWEPLTIDRLMPLSGQLLGRRWSGQPVHFIYHWWVSITAEMEGCKPDAPFDGSM